MRTETVHENIGFKCNEQMTQQRRKLSNSVRMQIAASREWKCYICDCSLPSYFQIDHKVALCLGGKDEYSNLAAICPGCHPKKTLMEVRCINSREDLYCFECNVHFSKYFIQAHVH
jgi:HNH endonuclease